MQKYFRIPLIFFFIAACMGLLLRWHFTNPVSWLTYPYMLHGHSHVMFLGWVLNVLYLGFVYHHLRGQWERKYKKIFILIQFLITGMLFSFPLQGYGVISIILSTAHTVAIIIFGVWFFRDTRKIPHSVSLWFAKYSLIFFIISSIGPFSLAPIMMQGLGYTKWYYLAVYYYLHFQYNGVFTFGALSLFFSLLEQRSVHFSVRNAMIFGKLLMIACFPAYILSTLWTNPGGAFNLIGFASAVIQIFALIYFLKMCCQMQSRHWNLLHGTVRFLFLLSLSGFVVKLFLQLLSAHPYIAQIAYEVRPYIIAYLHLVLVGVISLSLLGWYTGQKFLVQQSSISIWFFVTGYAGMELVLILTPQFSDLMNGLIADPSVMLVLFSMLMLLGLGHLIYGSFTGKQPPQIDVNE